MPRWTAQARAKQAAIIRQNKPWEKSTGPKTTAGKNRSAQNGFKHGFRSQEYLQLRRALIMQSNYVRTVEKLIALKKTHKKREPTGSPQFLTPYKQQQLSRHGLLHRTTQTTRAV